MCETDAINVVTINRIAAWSKCIRAGVLISNDLPTHLPVLDAMNGKHTRRAACTIEVDSTNSSLLE